MSALVEARGKADTIDAQQRAIKQAVDGLGSEWETSETDMSDATTSDDDASDWRVNA